MPNQWFNDKPIGINIMCRLCVLAGVQGGNFCNQSLRSSSLTHMHQAKNCEQEIKEYCGHCSNTVSGYKRTSADSNAKLSRVRMTVVCGENYDSDFEVAAKKAVILRKFVTSFLASQVPKSLRKFV